MENASKALIIAGAILLSIAIIGVGMYVFQIASGATENVGLQSEQAAAYNAKFDQYLGTSVRGPQVKTLLNTIRDHNNTHDTDENITVTGVTSASSVNSGKTYTVEVPSDGYDTITGYIEKINITVNP